MPAPECEPATAGDPLCDPSVPAPSPVLGDFGAAKVIPALASTGNDRDPTLTPDLLELFYSSDREGGVEHVYRSTRPTASDPWGTPVIVEEFSAFRAWSPEIASDGLSIWLVTELPGSKATDIWVAKRPSRGRPFVEPIQVANINGPSEDVGPNVDPSGLSMYLTSDRPGSMASDLYRASRAATSSDWSTPVRIDELASPGNDWDPFIADGGRLLFFVIDSDIVVAERSSSASPYEPAMPLSSVNSPSQESDPTLSADLRYIIFSSDRSGNRELYEARR